MNDTERKEQAASGGANAQNTELLAKMKKKRARKYALIALVCVIAVSTIVGLSIENKDAKLADGQGNTVIGTGEDVYENLDADKSDNDAEDADSDSGDKSSDGKKEDKNADKNDIVNAANARKAVNAAEA